MHNRCRGDNIPIVISILINDTLDLMVDIRDVNDAVMSPEYRTYTTYGMIPWLEILFLEYYGDEYDGGWDKHHTS